MYFLNDKQSNGKDSLLHLTFYSGSKHIYHCKKDGRDYSRVSFQSIQEVFQNLNSKSSQ